MHSKIMPLWLAILPLASTIGLIASQLILSNNFDPQVPLLFGIFLTASIGALRGWKWNEMEAGMFNIVTLSLPAIAMLLLIGVTISLWIASGTVPYLVYYGLKFISPKFFLVSAFVVCSLMSLALGTSWGTLGTLGIVLAGIGETLGFPLYMTAGAVVSGAFFGDKMSPISDTTNMAPAITGVKLFDHIKGMIPTTVPAMTIGLFFYLFIGLTYEPTNVDLNGSAALVSIIENTFHLTVWSLLPPVVISVMAVTGYAALPSIAGGVVSSFLLAVFVQDMPINILFSLILNGYSISTGQAIADNLFNRGGLVSMTPTLALVFLALTLGGLLEQLGCFDAILKAMLKKISKFWQLQGSAILGTTGIILGTGDSYLAMAFIGRLLSKAYDKMQYSRLNLSRAMEEGGTLLTPLVPWSASGIFIASTLGLNLSSQNSQDLLYIPFAVGCWLSPLLGLLFPILGWFSKKATEEEIKSYSSSTDELTLATPMRKFLTWYNPPASAYISTPQIAMDHGIKDVKIPLGDLMQYGNFGYGRCARGDVVIVDGQAHLCSGAKTTQIEQNLDVTSMNLTHFSEEISERHQNAGQSVMDLLELVRISPNCIYAYKLVGEFETVEFEDGTTAQGISGLIVGFYYPEFMEAFAQGSHLFFIGQDESGQGGRIKDARIANVILHTKQLPKLSAGLPVTLDFMVADLSGT